MFHRTDLRPTTAVIAAGQSSRRFMVRLSVNGCAPPGAPVS